MKIPEKPRPRIPLFGKVDARQLNLLLFLFLLWIPACNSEKSGAVADCDIERGSCTKPASDDGVAVTFDINPKPVKAMKALVFSASIMKDGRPYTGASAVLTLVMPAMVMGENKIRLTEKGGGLYSGEGVIVRCPSGHRVWRADLDIKGKGEQKGLRTSFTFEHSK